MGPPVPGTTRVHTTPQFAQALYCNNVALFLRVDEGKCFRSSQTCPGTAERTGKAEFFQTPKILLFAPITEGEREYTCNGHQSWKGRENIPCARLLKECFGRPLDSGPFVQRRAQGPSRGTGGFLK
eukprot:1173743-Prorocentrum_minimum.AAC.1